MSSATSVFSSSSSSQYFTNMFDSSSKSILFIVPKHLPHGLELHQRRELRVLVLDPGLDDLPLPRLVLPESGTNRQRQNEESKAGERERGLQQRRPSHLMARATRVASSPGVSSLSCRRRSSLDHGMFLKRRLAPLKSSGWIFSGGTT